MMSDEKIRKHFKGVFPRDFLPSKLLKNSIYVINLSPASSKGSHWVLLETLNAPTYATYICSLGQKPIHQDVLRKMYTVSPVIFWNDFKCQQEWSTVCGMHTIFSAGLLVRGHDPLSIMTDFYTDDPYKNDMAIMEILSTEFGIKEIIPICDPKFILKSESLNEK